MPVLVSSPVSSRARARVCAFFAAHAVSKQKLAEYQERLQEAMREVAYAKSSGQRQELMAGAQPSASANAPALWLAPLLTLPRAAGAAAPNQLTNDQLAAKTSEVHDKIDESLDRQMRKLEETKAVRQTANHTRDRAGPHGCAARLAQVAVNTAGALVSQTEQMGRIANEVDRMEEGLQRADKVRAFVHFMQPRRPHWALAAARRFCEAHLHRPHHSSVSLLGRRWAGDHHYLGRRPGGQCAFQCACTSAPRCVRQLTVHARARCPTR